MGFAQAADNFLNTYVFGWILRLLRNNFGSLSRAAWVLTWVAIILIVAWIVSSCVRRFWCLNDCCTGILLNVPATLLVLALAVYFFGLHAVLSILMPWTSMEIFE
jgi:polyferredoxin